MTHQLSPNSRAPPQLRWTARLGTTGGHQPWGFGMEACKLDRPSSPSGHGGLQEGLEIARAHGRAQGLVSADEMAQEIYEAGHSPDVRTLATSAARLMQIMDEPSPEKRRREED